MARKRAVDSVKAISTNPPRGDDSGPSSVSVDVRQISNGYISTHSTTKDGEYNYKEEYHETRPQIEEIVGGASRDQVAPAGPNHLAGAVALLKRGKA